MSNSALLSLHRVLQKCFDVITQQRDVWAGVLRDCTPLLGSLGNLGQQLQACAEVDLRATPLQRFPDLQQRLRYKLLNAVDTVLGQLGDKMCVLQAARDAISNQVTPVFQLYEQHIDTLGLAAAVERSPLAPSVADMLEWLQDIDRFYRNQFLRRKVLLQSIKPDNVSQLLSVPQAWSRLSPPDSEDFISDALMKVSFFMDSR
ncbi:AFG2-interacting ribosome maturation factor isoform X2 [Amia ocellicauda]